MKSSFFNYLPLLALFFTVVVFDDWLKSVEVRSDGPFRRAVIRFEPVAFAPAGFAPLRLAGAWKVKVDDPRFGGVSALVLDGGTLLALTDSGSIIRFPLPGRAGRALVRDLPSGPGMPQFKINRDSEALARDPAGRGWWVAFEHWHQLWLYDAAFSRSIAIIDFGRGRWGSNRGLEAMIADASGFRLFPELGKEWLQLVGRQVQSRRLHNPYGDLADAVRLPDGRLLLVTRKFELTGIAKQLAVADWKGGEMTLHPFARLGLGATDNVEAIAAQPRADGSTRLWLMTDNDFRPRKATLLVALDLP